MVRHPKPNTIANHLRQLAKRLEDHGDHAVDLAALLAARGYPTSVTGDGTGSRTNLELTSVEAAATPDQWAGTDERLAKLLRLIWHITDQLDATITNIVAHASDIDPLPAGTGACVACQTFCRPDHKRPHERLKAGLCPPCWTAWCKWRRIHNGGRDTYLIDRRHQLAEPA